MFLKEKESILELNFHESIGLKKLKTIFSRKKTPQVVLWYIGCNGLKNKTIEYYRNNIIHPVLQVNPITTFWLLDLVAWNSFKSKSGSIYKSSSYCETIYNLNDSRLKPIGSSKIFQDMLNLNKPEIIRDLDSVSKLDFLKKVSASYPNTGIITRDIFRKKLKFGDMLLNKDSSKSYAFFQYVEGCMLVKNIIEQSLLDFGPTSDIEIIFLLPNDELKYYNDGSKTFMNSIESILNSSYKSRNFNLFIDFYSFPFGSSSACRPYIVKDKPPSKNALTLSEIIGSTNIISENKNRAYA